jgi:hypothetical protein
MAQKYVNNAISTLSSGLGISDTALTVYPGHGSRWPAITAPDYAYTTLEDGAGNIEVIKITTHTGSSDSFTIVRAQQGTTARAWSIGDLVEMRITAEEITRFETAGLRTGDTYSGTHDFDGADLVLVPTPATADISTKAANTAFVRALIAQGVTGSASTIEEEKTSASGQTVFTLTNVYTPGTASMRVWINGIRQHPSSYAETNLNTVTFSEGLNEGDKVLFEIGVITSGELTSAALVTVTPSTNQPESNAQTAFVAIGDRVASLEAAPPPVGSILYLYQNAGGF